MPDETVTPAQSDLERLMAEAQTSHATPQPTPSPSNTEPLGDAISVPKTQAAISPDVCDHVGSEPHERKWCRLCKKKMCFLCWSILDPTFCSNCLSEPDAELVEHPLRDTDGVEHTNGRELTPAP